MAEENEKNPGSALEELRRLKRTDRIKSVEFHEPELQDFHAENIFHIDEEPEKKTIFGKRSQKTHVEINSNVFDEEVSKPEYITTKTTIEELEAPIEKTVIEPHFIKPIEDVKEEIVTEPEEVEETTGDITMVQPEAEVVQQAVEQAKAEEIEEVEDDDEDELDPNEELYVEKKKFLFADYNLMEEYLQEKSSDGYHFVKHEGKKFYFRKGKPRTYYYSMNYFVDEPDADQWHEWEQEGWKLVSKASGKKRSDTGWLTFRNEEEEGEYRKEIDNDSEKYVFFKKYANSCRSTMFLVFVCMACCLITGSLQIYFQGYLAGIALCIGLFLVAFIVFCMYGRMLRKAKKRARQLKSKLRIREAREIENSKDIYDTSESEEELDTDWNTLEHHTQKHKRGLFRRMDNDYEEDDFYDDEDDD